MAVKGDSSNGTAVIAMIHERTREDKSAEKISCAPPLARSGRLTHRRATRRVQVDYTLLLCIKVNKVFYEIISHLLQGCKNARHILMVRNIISQHVDDPL